MSTYKDIQQYIKQKYSVSVKTCWIADMKEKCGMDIRNAPNRINPDPEARKHPCPKNKEKFILEAFRFFNMI